MKFDLDSWEEIFITLTRNKSRSLLTAFGVFWGIFMLIVLIGMGRGLEGLMNQNFEGSNQNSSILFTGRTSLPYKGFQKGRYWNLDNTDISLLKSIEGIDAVCPILAQYTIQANYKELKTEVQLIGTTDDYDKLQDQDMQYGRFLNSIDVLEKRKVCTLGNQVYKDLFPFGGDPIGEYIDLQGVYFQVIGITNNTNSAINFAGPPATHITIPATTLQMVYNRGIQIDLLLLGAKKEYTMTQLQDEVEKQIKAAHTLAPEDTEAVTFVNTEAMYGFISNLLLGINILSWLVGVGTLLAGIIGVSNIMMITVKERTTEFGIRRAIGALPQDILGQIILESIVITLLAGTAGIGIGVLTLSGVETVVNMLTESNTFFQVSFGLALAVFAALIGLGILAGMAPAYRALAIKPIDAIRED